MPYKVKIENVVSTASLDSRLDLWAIEKEFSLYHYPSKFPGLVFRLSDPKTSLLMFRSGKIVCSGAKSSKFSEKAVHEAVKKLKKRNLYAGREPKILIQNIVATIELPYKEIDLENVHNSIASGRSIYEPGEFPGLVYRMDDPKVAFLLFKNGKAVCAGARSEEEVYRASDNLYKMLGEINL